MQHRATLWILLCTALAGTSQATGIEVRTLGANGTLGAQNELAKALCERCADGDYLVSNGSLEVAIGGSHRRDQSFYKFATADTLGSIVFLRPAGTDARGDIMLGSPYVRIGNTTRHIAYEQLEMTRSGERVSFNAHALYVGPDAARIRFEVRYDFAAASERVDIRLTATNVGSEPIDDFVYALFFDPHQVYDFSPADVAKYRKLAFRAYPRANHLIGWLDQTTRLAVSDDRYGWDGGMILPDPLAIRLAPGISDARKYALIASADSGALLASLYQAIEIDSHLVSLEFESESNSYFELVVREADSAAVFYRAFRDRPAPFAIALPAGTYTLRANFFPGVAECSLTVSESAANRCRLQDPPLGKARIRILDSAGHFVPGKLSFRGSAQTPSPYFRPENPAYDDGYWESYKNSVFPSETGSVVTLPVGSYRVAASRGPEFSVDEQDLTISAGTTEERIFRIDRVIDRPDLISLDSHLHTLESDGAVGVEQKIRAIVAEGIDVAIATDHNLPVDYRPALAKLGLKDQLIVFAGAEVTVPERLDYNSYPMEVRPTEHNHGAIDALSTDLTALFRASRARDRGVVLQVNHPRSWQFDYFQWHELDPESAAFANEGFDLSFDVLEVVNGPDYDSANNQATRNDWLNLLRRGYFFPLVGTSDSHEIDRDEPGYSRTYIYRDPLRGAQLDAEYLMQRIRQGRSFASNGPILDLLVAERYRPGDTVSVRSGIVDVGIDVWTAPWIEASAVSIYVNGERRSVPTRPLSHATARHFRADLALQLDRDSYLVAEVRGSKPLAPVVQARSAAGAGETEAGNAEVLPYALTNPIFIDLDGNGKFDPPLPHEIEIRAAGAAQRPLP